MNQKYPKIFMLSTIFVLGLASFVPQKALAQPSATECDRIARDFANRNSRGEALTRGAIGAGVGALTGAIFGGAGTGAAIGGGLGVVSGGSKQMQDREQLYQAAFDDCMRGIPVN